MKARCVCGNIATENYLGVIKICKSCMCLIKQGKEDEPVKVILKYVNDVIEIT